MQTKAKLVLALTALSVGLFAATGQAQDKKDETKGEMAVRAAAIDFPAAYNLALEGLTSVGGRIDQNRQHPDPVALALIATELEAAEQVSGKKAAVTAADIRKEAIEMAKRRANADELKVVAMLIVDANAKSDLQKLSAAAAERDALAKQGERPRGIGTLTVNNFTNHKIWIYVNDCRVGWVNPYGQYSYQVNQPGYMTTKLLGRSANGVTTWGPRLFAEDYSRYTWSLR